MILTILAFLYDGVTRARNLLFDLGLLRAFKCKIPVVSIGNLSVGGNGKTPLCLFLAQELKARGKKPVILSRGYGGKICGPHLVKLTDKVYDVGDEPLLLAQGSGCPVVVCKNRALGANFIQGGKLGDVIILDDGFQHRWLARDFDIVCVNIANEDAIQDFLRAEILPLGRFREARDAGLRRAHAVIFSARKTGDPLRQVDRRLVEVLPDGMKYFSSGFELAGIFTLAGGGKFEGKAAVAFSGIANPEGFFDSLIASGITLAGKRAFPDHYAFKAEDITKLQREFPGAALVCTEKDGVRIPESERVKINVMRIVPKVVLGEEFIKLVLAAISSN